MSNTSRDGTGDDATPQSPSRLSLVNLPNILTMLRIAIVPLFLIVLLHNAGQDPWWRVTAFVIFAAAIITDRFDGEIARKRGLVTEFGKLMDPIADKALIGAALVGLSIINEVWWWVTAAILLREIGLTVMRFIFISDGVIAANRGGKLKTFLQAIVIGLYLLPLPSEVKWPLGVLMAITVVVTIATGIDYVAGVIRSRGVRARRLRANDGSKNRRTSSSCP